MTNVGLDRAERAICDRIGLRAVGLGNRRNLDRITHRRAGSVRLDVADAPRFRAGVCESLEDYLGLPWDTRRC